MPCPKCGNINIGKWGKYKGRRRYVCKDCNYHFIIRTGMYKKRIPINTRYEILKLFETKKGFINKYDNLKKETYTIREIARMLKLKKSFVNNIVRDYYGTQWKV